MSTDKDQPKSPPAPPKAKEGGDTVELDVHGEMIRRWRNMQREFQPTEDDPKPRPPPPTKPA